jgi:ssDNA-binding replication factor A large subunit
VERGYIDKVETGHAYQLNNGYTTVFKGSLRLNIGRYGSLEELRIAKRWM